MKAGGAVLAASILVGGFFLVLGGLAASGDATGPQMFAGDVLGGVGSFVFGNVAFAGFIALLVVPMVALSRAGGVGVAVALLWPPLLIGALFGGVTLTEYVLG